MPVELETPEEAEENAQEERKEEEDYQEHEQVINRQKREKGRRVVKKDEGEAPQGYLDRS